MHQLKTNVGSLNPLLEPHRLFHIDLPFIDEQILKMTSSETLWHDKNFVDQLYLVVTVDRHVFS